MKSKISFLFLLFFAGIITANAALNLTNLKTEGLVNPQGIDTELPRFSWQITATTEQNVMQQAYHIIVSSSVELLNQDKGDLWDSGKRKSDQSIWIPYEGKKLNSNGQYFWKVKVWTNRGETSWSNAASWSMGLLSQNDWKSRWIGLDRASEWDSETQWSRLSARYLRKEFSTGKQIRRATVHIAGLGLYELFINGHRIGDQVLAPAPTDYRKTILYNTYDITKQLQQGNNAIGVTLGNGRYYTMRQNYKPYKIPTFGYPKLRLNLMVEYTDGTTENIGSNETWKLTADGPVRSNNEYDGEEYDARKELTGWNKPGYDDSEWMNAQRVAIPDGTLRAQMMPGMKVMDKITPKTANRVNDKYILDMGQNMVGWLRIKVTGDKGDSIKLRFAELLQPNGELYTENLRDALVTDIYVLKGEGIEDWSPRFVYHGFRYVEISGLKHAPVLSNFIGEVVHDEMETLGTFNSSNDILNQLHKNAWWGIAGNYKGMPVDCPQRNERQPWLGDRTMGSWGESFLFDNNAMYAKWGNDIRDAQREDGCIPDVAPAYWNYYSDNVTWPAALPMLCDMTYTHFGNIQPIRENYPAIKKWLQHIRKEYMSENYIVDADQYGDWCVPPESLEMIHSRDPRRQTDGKLLSTAYYYKMLELAARFATLQGLNNEAKLHNELAAKIKKAFHQEFFRTDSLFYGNNSATSNLLPLAFGIVPQQFRDTVSKHIISSVVKNNTPLINTGVIGTQWIMRELSKMGRADVAFTLASNTAYPSWGYMIENGATTIWELWNGNTASPKMNSGNHVMLLGDLLVWTYENLAGIKSSYDRVAFKHLIMKPNFDIPDLDFIDASYQTPYGKVVSKWKKTLMQLEWQVTLPPNTTAELHFPNGKTKKVGSGSYQFNIEIPRKKGVVTTEYLYEKADFPQCHSATLAETENGDLVAAYFGGTREGHPDVCIYVSRKEKGSKQWSKPALAADGIFSPVLRKACYNPVLFQVPGGEMLLFYKIGSRVSDWKGYLKRSYDGGKTWSQQEELPEGFLGPIKNKPELVDGKLICPSSTEGSEGWRVHFEITEDWGKTWRKVGPIDATDAIPTHLESTGKTSFDIEGGDNSVRTVVQAIQPSILKHKDGRLQILCRTRNGAVATSWSTDKGESWSPLTLSQLPNNNSGTDAVTLANGTHAIIYNALRTPKGLKKGSRTPLNIAVSKDGINWKMAMELENSPVSQYSYPVIFQGNDGRVHIAYTWRRQRVKYMEVKL